MSDRKISGFQLDIPDDWHDQSLVAFVSPRDNDGAYKNIVLTREARNGRDVEAVVHDFEQQLIKQGLPALKIGAKAEGTIDGIQAKVLSYSHARPASGDQDEEVQMARRQVFVVKNDTVYSISLADTSAERQAIGVAFESILKSIKLP